MRRALLHGIDWPQGGTMRGRNTAVAIIASLFALETAHADPLTIRSGWVVMTSGYTPMVVEAKDQLKHYGSSYIIDPIHFQGSAPSMAALASGGVDIIPIGYSTLLTAVVNAKMDDIRVVADDFQDGVEGYSSVPFMVRNDNLITKVEDLKGHVVATNSIGGAFDIGLRAMLRKHRLEDKRDVTIVESDYGNMNSMLLSKKVDLTIGAQPGVSDPAFRATTYPLFTMRDATGGRTQVLVFAARTGFLEKNRAALIDFFTDMLALSRRFHDPAHRPEAIALAARVTKQPYERLNSYLFSTSDFYSDPKGMPDAGALQSGIDMMVALGFAKESIDVKRYLDLSLVQEAAKRLP
jgi:sulfonate transport system substrate-binding protein